MRSFWMMMAGGLVIACAGPTPGGTPSPTTGAGGSGGATSSGSGGTGATGGAGGSEPSTMCGGDEQLPCYDEPFAFETMLPGAHTPQIGRIGDERMLILTADAAPAPVQGADVSLLRRDVETFPVSQLFTPVDPRSQFQPLFTGEAYGATFIANDTVEFAIPSGPELVADDNQLSMTTTRPLAITTANLDEELGEELLVARCETATMDDTCVVELVACKQTGGSYVGGCDDEGSTGLTVHVGQNFFLRAALIAADGADNRVHVVAFAASRQGMTGSSDLAILEYRSNATQAFELVGLDTVPEDVRGLALGVTGRNDDGVPSLFVGTGDDTVITIADPTEPSAQEAIELSPIGLQGMGTIALVDLNRDEAKAPELVVGRAGQLSVIMNDGHGVFASGSDVPVGVGWADKFFAHDDLDGDGTIDFVSFRPGADPDLSVILGRTLQ